ncbi:UDP-N-acetylmuramate:L-alanyl-gamma-D-glutamyl-meso-diaminopimelate ligase, partial [bacterium]
MPFVSGLKEGARVHFVGVCGTAMASVAGRMKDLGYLVTGSDVGVYPPMSTFLENKGIEVKGSFDAANLT